MAAMTMVPATRADADAVATLHLASWRATYRGIFSDAFLDGPDALADRRALWDRRLAPDFPARWHVLLARDDDGTLRGFACVLPDEEPDAGVLLDNLHVHPASQGQGVGRQLLQAARDWAGAQEPASPLVLYVFERNARAVGFYDRMGGTVVARRVSGNPVAGGAVELRYAWPPARTPSP
jgi:ribosomal protein S18 acetylase RimI-like enzyme